MARKGAGEELLPEDDPLNPIFKPLLEPSRLDSFLITNQVSNYCNQNNSSGMIDLKELSLVIGKATWMDIWLLTLLSSHYSSFNVFSSFGTADEIAKLVNENEHLKSIINEKVYALTRERDTLRREQNKRSDATALLKEKDEIITQVVAEGYVFEFFLQYYGKQGNFMIVRTMIHHEGYIRPVFWQANPTKIVFAAMAGSDPFYPVSYLHI
ncbi:hypothetical protein CTI12_AA195140 [Artemisia annua]|uniref:eIF3h C-terminal domain-containing protein n=1 Tax=Artemisia annua TaxID=35608 RepID=A0A2U1P454_ARTAN|nr:hypothetical protein CTI12_AA195140 [Artemisia annua]